VWCGSCYTPHPKDNFFRFVPTDEDGFEWRPAEDQPRYLYARDGDHLQVPFQCDLCMFQNLAHRNPCEDDPKDDLLLCCIRRINLDAVWGREPGTVSATLCAAQQMVKLLDKVDLCPELPARGPFPVADSFGAKAAISMILKSLEHMQIESWVFKYVHVIDQWRIQSAHNGWQ
jgi:hypothetical protein